MNSTSTYARSFFLPGKNLSISEKKFVMPTESFYIEYSSNKNDMNMTRNIVWICPKCGHTHVGATASGTCPVCNSNYEIKEN